MTVDEESIKVWEIQTAAKIQTLSVGHVQFNDSAIFSYDGLKLLTTSRNAADVWDLSSHRTKCSAMLEGVSQL